MTISVSRWLAAALAACALIYAPPALAGDFNFTVPVALTELPPTILRGKVRCIANQVVPGAFVAIGEGWSPEFAIVDGAYSGTVSVEVNASSAHDPSQANRYDCELWLQVRRTTGAVSFYSAYALAQESGPIEARIQSTSSSLGVRSYQNSGPLGPAH